MAKKNEQPQQSNLLLDSKILEALGIAKQPFASTVLSEQEIYFDSALTKLIDSLKHHMQFSPLLLIVEGVYGSGKTTLFRHLSQCEITNIKLLPVQAEASDTLTQIQHKMSFHLEDLGSANYLENNLKHLSTFDTVPALIIDDAHTLSDTVIQELIRYQTELKQTREIELKILLIANPGMAETLEKITQLDHSQLYVQKMPQFNEKQILNFCQHRLLSSGYSGQPLLDSENAQQILKKSDGVALYIMEACVSQIQKKFKTKKSLSLPVSNKLISAIAISIIAFGFVFYFLQTEQTPPLPAEVITEQSQPPARPVIIQPELQAEIETPEKTPLDHIEETSSTVDPVPAETIEPESVIKLIDTRIPAVPAEPEQPTEPEAAPEPPAAPVAEIRNTVDELEKDAGKTIHLADTLMDKKALQDLANDTSSEPEPMIAAEKEIMPKAISKKETTTTEVKTVTAPRKAALHPALIELTKMGIHDPDWLRKQDPRHFTLQILGAREPETLVKLARQHKLGDDSAWYQTQLSGKPWYVLVHRFYTDRDIARASVTRLPAGLQYNKPWVKSIADIQQAIK